MIGVNSRRSFLIQEDDLVIENGKLKMVDGDLEVCQCVERAITTRFGEFFLKLDHGMDYTEFEKKAPSEEKLKFAVIEAALQEERVRSISKIDVDFDRANRTARIDFTFTLVDGEEIQGSVVI